MELPLNYGDSAVFSKMRRERGRAFQNREIHYLRCELTDMDNLSSDTNWHKLRLPIATAVWSELADRVCAQTRKILLRLLLICSDKIAWISIGSLSLSFG